MYVFNRFKVSKRVDKVSFGASTNSPLVTTKLTPEQFKKKLSFGTVAKPDYTNTNSEISPKYNGNSVKNTGMCVYLLTLLSKF